MKLKMRRRNQKPKQKIQALNKNELLTYSYYYMGSSIEINRIFLFLAGVP